MADSELPTGMNPPVERPSSFFRELVRAFAYPLAGHGPYVIMVWIGIRLAVQFVREVLVFIPFIGLAGWAVMLIIGAIYLRYMMEIIGETAGGKDKPPDLPAMTGGREEALHTLLMAGGATLMAFGPTLICRALEAYDVLRMTTLKWVFVPLGVVYLPMALLAAALYDTLEGLNPAPVVLAIVRVGWRYLAACLMMAIVCAVFVAGRWAVAHIPWLGGALGGGLLLYALMAQMRIIGLIYRFHEDRIGWFNI